MGGVVSDLLTGQFGAESLRVSLMSMSILTVMGGWLFWRAAGHYPGDLAQARQPQSASTYQGMAAGPKLKEA
jgi:ABC-type nickel/cobalt efflux system permease component RcnA